MANQAYPIIGYGLSQALPAIFPVPINGKRAPTTSDIGYQLGQIWLYNSNAYILVNVGAGVATWLLLESGGGAGVFASLTVTPGPTSITGTTGINTSGTGVTTIGTGGTGAVNIGNATGNTAVTGSLSTTTSLNATTTITSGTGITATTGNIVATAGNITATAGSMSAGTTVTAGTGITATTGNITATNGNFVLSTAATYISLPGPVFIYSGSGAPNNALALHVGDMYINTSAASATTRLYIATAADTWVNVTCAG